MRPYLKLSICIFALPFLSLLVGCQQAKVAVPQNFDNWNSKDGAFAIDYPADWEPKGGASTGHGSSWAKFEEGGISIKIDASFTQSVLGDLMGNAGDTSELPDHERPEALLHDYNIDYYTENYRNYEELTIETKRLPIGMTRIAEFSASLGPLSGKIKGIRATTCTMDKGITFRAYAPESQWEEFKPVFEQMLDGMKRGRKEM